jgi:hypothetical protein
MNRLEQDDTEVNLIPDNVKELLDSHREAIVITADPDQGESKIAVFTKLLDSNGVIAPLLADLLSNLLKSVRTNGCSSA